MLKQGAGNKIGRSIAAVEMSDIKCFYPGTSTGKIMQNMVLFEIDVSILLNNNISSAI